MLKTSKANAMNLGGHIDRNGVVDDMATPHLRDAFKKHRTSRCRPHPMHIETQNINLTKVAVPGLLTDDRQIEQEQGVRFERVVSR